MEDIVFRVSLTSDSIVFIESSAKQQDRHCSQALAGKGPRIDPDFSLTAAREKVLFARGVPCPTMETSL
jgi:hypothetical protein